MRLEYLFECFEELEARRVLSLADGVGVQRQFYPEGFANAAVTEMVMLSNPGTQDVQYEIWARYETGARDQLMRAGSVAAGERDNVSISDPANPGAILVRPNAPYAIEIRSFGELSAALEHDDWGSSAGESFSTVVSTEWTFPTVVRDGATTRDYIVLFNPQDRAITANLEFYQDGQVVFSAQKDFGALRRGGWNVSKLPGLHRGVYSVQLTTSEPVIAALSHYDLVHHNSSTTLGTRNRGDKAGAVLAAEWEDREHPGSFAASNDTQISIFNPGSAPAQVTLHFLVRDGSTPAEIMVVRNVSGHRRDVVSLRDLNLGPHDLSIVYRSDVIVSVTAFIERRSAFFNTSATTLAATQWTFPVAFTDRVHAGVLQTEDVLAFNPTNHAVTVSFSFIFADGRQQVVSRTVEPFKVADVDTSIPVQGLGAGRPFMVRVLADGPIVTSLEHWNRLGMFGAFLNQGIPGGTVLSLADALSPEF